MITTLDLYRIFHTVCQNKSFSKAATELYMTQSAVSQAVAKLEKELDLKLFHRTPKGVVPTYEGTLLNEHITSALGIIAIAEDKLLEFKQLKTGELRIGVGDTITRYFLLPFLEQFYSMHPGIKVSILNGTTSEICEYIKAGKADIGFCNLPINEDYLQVIPCKDIQDIFVCGEKYKEIANRPLKFEELIEFPLIFLEKKSNSRLYVEKFLNKNGVLVHPTFELGAHDLVLQFAISNLGISCVIKEFSKDYLESGKLFEVKLEEEIPKRSIGICYMKKVPLSYAAETFLNMVQKS